MQPLSYDFKFSSDVRPSVLVSLSFQCYDQPAHLSSRDIVQLPFTDALQNGVYSHFVFDGPSSCLTHHPSEARLLFLVFAEFVFPLLRNLLCGFLEKSLNFHRSSEGHGIFVPTDERGWFVAVSRHTFLAAFTDKGAIVAVSVNADHSECIFAGGTALPEAVSFWYLGRFHHIVL